MALETRSEARQKADAEVLDGIRDTGLYVQMAGQQQAHYNDIGHTIATADLEHFRTLLEMATSFTEEAWHDLVDYAAYVLKTDWDQFWANAKTIIKACQALGELEKRNAEEDVRLWTELGGKQEDEEDEGDGEAANVGTLTVEQEMWRKIESLRTVREGVWRQLRRVEDALRTLNGMLEG